jgi:hypothetical protein
MTIFPVIEGLLRQDIKNFKLSIYFLFVRLYTSHSLQITNLLIQYISPIYIYIYIHIYIIILNSINKFIM